MDKDNFEVIEINANNYKTTKTEYCEYQYLLVGSEKISKNNNANSYVAFMEYLIDNYVINNSNFVNNKKLSTVQSDIGTVKWANSHKGYFYRYQHGNSQQVKHIFECYKEFAPEVFSEMKLVLKNGNKAIKSSQIKDPRTFFKFTPHDLIVDWEKCKSENNIAIGFKEENVGDLSIYSTREEMNLAFGLESNSQKNYPWNLWLMRDAKIGDVVLVSGGLTKCIGVGIITGDYTFIESEPLYRHKRSVKWLADKEFNYIPNTIRKYPELFRRDMFSPTLIGKEIIQEYLKVHPEYYEIFKANNLINTFSQTTMESNLTAQESLLLLSLLTKPFSILYGVSGTGKSRVVKELWKKLNPGTDETGKEDYLKYFQKEAVPPNWFDDTEIIGRYNKIEKFIEGKFTKLLEKAIKDPEHNYVYLLDEMNLSHIEQYFSQYLSAIEELNDGKGWINVGDTENYSVKKYLDGKINNEVIVDLKNPINLVKVYEFVKGSLKVDGTEISSELNFADFQVKIFKYIIDNHLDSGNEDDNLFDKSNITTIDKLKNEGMDISHGQDKVNFDKEGGTIFYVKKKDWKATLNCYFYKGYVIYTGHDNNTRVKEIKKLVELIGNDLLDNLRIIFSPKEAKSSSISNENIIYYYNDQNELIGKSLKLPKNLFVVGTINLDETTKSISPKVVDRANLIEFNDLDDFLFISDTNRYDLSFLTQINLKNAFIDVLNIRKDILNLKDKEQLPDGLKISKSSEDLLKKLYEFLKVFKLHFSYRTLKEIIIFINIGKKLGITDEKRLLDIAIAQKVLPKLNGIIDFNFKLSDKNGEKFLRYDFQGEDNSLLLEFKNILEAGFVNFDNDFNNSAKKLKRMQQFFNTYQNVNYFLS